MDEGGSPCSLNEVTMAGMEAAEEMATASLAEVLASRNGFLEEEEFWALCRECCLTLEYVHECHDLFQSLCISPDTVAFDPEGNVCFLDLDMEPEAQYIAPESAGYGENSFKSHLFSLGMTLLYATEYNTESDDPRAHLSDTFTELLNNLTSDDIEQRPDLDTVIEACEKALGGEGSQEICLRIVGLQEQTSPVPNKGKSDGSSFQQMTDELTAYLESQSGLVQNTTSPPTSVTSTDIHNQNSTAKSTTKEGKVTKTSSQSTKDSKRDVNDNCLYKTNGAAGQSKKSVASQKGHLILRDASLDEEDIMSESQEEIVTPRRSRKQQGILLVDLLNSLDRYLDESELWSLCRESVLALQRKKKHLPAYISLDTLMIRDSGTISFKAIPEDKPLEVIYMAPELQQKGILNDKTCLYGLGITLCSAAGIKYSSKFSIPDGEALEILVQSFVQVNPAKRPNLDTALEMCEEYEKVSEIKSRQICLNIYQEALAMASSSRSDSLSATTQEQSSAHRLNKKEEKESMNGFDSELETTQISSENTHSMAQGDTTEAEDNIDDIPFDEDQDDTVTPNSAFKPLRDAAEDDSVSNTFSSSAFKPVAVKPKPVTDLYRVPSAFSSPATHFKPIVIHENTSKSADSKEQGQKQNIQPSSDNKEKDVVAKLREIKHNLLKHKSAEPPAKETPASDNVQSLDAVVSGSNSNQSVESTQLSTALQQLQSQGQLPSTDVLASAIAQYLKSHLTGSVPDPHHMNTVSMSQGNVASSGNGTSATSSYAQNVSSMPFHSTSLHSAHDQISSQPTRSHVSQAIQHFTSKTVSATAAPVTMSTHEVPYSSSITNTGMQSSGPVIQGAGAPVMPLQNAFPLPLSATSMAGGGQYSVPMSGMSSTNMPVQFTLVQDPHSGMMQMVPMSYVPISQAHSPQGIPFMQQYIPGLSANSLPSSGAQLHNANQPHRQNDNAGISDDHVSGRPSGYNFTSENQTPARGRPSRPKSSDNVANRLSQPHGGHRSSSSHRQGGREDNNSQSSSPSPSKDSGICVTQQPGTLPYNKDTLMERLWSSENSQRQRVLSHVVQIIREEFAEDGVFDTGVEDLAIAEYIMSLSSLTWETFRSAVSEKYFQLVWTYDLLAALYQAIGGPKPPDMRYASKTPPAARSKPFLHRAMDKVDRKRRQSEPEVENYESQQQAVSAMQQQYQEGVYSKASYVEHRPRSEIGIGKAVWSETSDSTDNDARDKKRRFKKRCELDKTKSSSMHNIAVDSNSVVPEQSSSSKDLNQRVSATGVLNQNNPSVFSKDYYKVKTNNSAVPSGSQMPNHSDHPSVVNDQSRKSIQTGNNTNQSSAIAGQPNFSSGSNNLRPPSHVNDGREHQNSPGNISHFSSKTEISSDFTQHKNGSDNDRRSISGQTFPQNSQFNSNRVPTKGPPLKPSYAHNSSYPPSHMLVNRDYADSSSSDSPKEQRSSLSTSMQMSSHNSGKKGASPLPSYPSFTSDHSDGGKHYPHPNMRSSKELPRPQQENEQPSRHPGMHGQAQPLITTAKPPDAFRSPDMSHNYNSDSDFNTSSEMRRLAAQKPELYNERHASGLSSPLDRSTKSVDQNRPVNVSNTLKPEIHDPTHRPTSRNEVSTHPHRNLTHNRSHSSHLDVPNSQHKRNGSSSSMSPPNTSNMTFSSNFEIHLPNSRAHIDNTSAERPKEPYGRSMSAVYSRQTRQPETGVQVIDMTNSDGAGLSSTHHRRGSDGSIQLPEINSTLLPYTKRGQVVYHSAMIQLSLTPEVDSFIHSIDEENKPAIENRLASICQQIAMQRRERRKTQKFYKKLNDQGAAGKNSKGDQNVSDQMLKDMTEMTKNLAFLYLCQTHLQMLLAELYGLDSCFLYSLCASDGSAPIVLQPYMENPYLQFRTISTPQAGQMCVLQAGTPRGLMSYLYTSSALSDGYIHQFLLCFRYILTSEQLLTFILDKCHSAQSGSPKDLNMIRIQRRSLDLLYFWIEGYYSVDFAPNRRLIKKLADFLKEQTDANVEGADNLFSMYAACRMGENTELMLTTEMDEDQEEDTSYFTHLANPKRWESFRSLLKRSKSDKSNRDSSGGSGKSKTDFKDVSVGGGRKSTHQFSIIDCPAHTLAEQLTLIEQDYFRKCHPVHFLNSQAQGVGVALSMPGLRTPSMSRKSDANQSSKRGLFIGEPVIESYVVHMIGHSHELAHWVSAEILSCGSNKTQTNIIIKFLTVAHMCHEVRNFASALSILDGLENLVVRQLPVWKNIPAKVMTYMDELTDTKMKLKSEAMWLMSDKDSHIYPTIPCVLFAMLHLQQSEIGSFSLANGMFKWDKMRSITEMVDQFRIFRDHEYGFEADLEVQSTLRRRLNEYSEQDLHAVASTHDNNFRRHSSSSSLSGTLKRVKDKLQSKKK